MAAASGRGGVWIGTRQGLWVVEEGAELARRVEGGPSEIIQMVRDAAGEVWIASSTEGLFRTRGQVVERVAEAEGLDEAGVRGLARDPRGRIWVATRGNGLLCLEPGGRLLHRLRHDPASSATVGSDDLFAVVATPDEAVWVASSAGGVDRVDPVTLECTPWRAGADAHREIPANRILTMSADPADGVWVGTARGLVHLTMHSTDWGRYDPRDPWSLSSNAVQAIECDRLGGVWFGTSGGGVCRLDPNLVRFRTMRAWVGERDAAISQAMALLEAPAGVLWIGTPIGLVRQEADEAAMLESLDGVRVSVTSLCLADARSFWMGTGTGLYRVSVEGEAWRTPTLALQTTEVILCIVPDPSGDLWLGTSQGLIRFDPRNGDTLRYRHEPTDPRTLPSDIVAALEVDRDGALWVGTLIGGLSRLPAGADQFENFLPEPGRQGWITNKSVQEIVSGRDGAIWIGTYSGGVNRFDPATRSFRNWTERDGLAGDKVNALLEDADGRMWLSTNRGLSRLDPASGQITNYDRADGLQPAEFLPRSAWVTADGEFLFGGVDGVNAFRPSEIRRNPVAPPVVLTAFRRFDRTTPVGLVLGGNGTIELSHRDDFIAFEFAALDYAPSRYGNYAYQLEGFDRDWVRCGARRYAAYTNLDPGRYTFRVKAANRDGVWNEAGLSIPLFIRPPFWRTPWFVLGCVAALSGTLLQLHRLRLRVRVRRLLAEERIRSAERERVQAQVSRDYHDDVGVQLTRISLYTELVRRGLNGAASTEVSGYVQKIAGSAESVIQKTRDFIWALDPARSRLSDLLGFFEDAGRVVFGESEIRFEVGRLPDACASLRLRPEEKRHLSLLFKEAMHNALKHSGARQVSLAIWCESDRLSITLEDDGAGLPAEAGREPGRTGFGLENMQARARECGGRVRVENRPEGGVIVRYEGPLASPVRVIEADDASRLR
ncbi:MAG: hypothetical protein IPK72_02110 [Candidatus Eisenbacteria bacterium]|nr:hypothetical protein [Candidatus Eisenbacteria bacterium]